MHKISIPAAIEAKPLQNKRQINATDPPNTKAISLDESMSSRPFSLGKNVNFQIGENSLLFYFIDPGLENFINSPVNQIVHRTCYYFFDKFVIKEHHAAVNDLFPKAIDYLETNWQENPTINLIFNIYCTVNYTAIKRILLQLQKGNQQLMEDEVMLEGKIHDITELCSDGLPKLLLIKNYNLEKVMTCKEYSNTKSTIFGLSFRELNVLELKCKGKRTKEISQTLNISEMSIYSIIRDIKEKTQMDIIPLIQILSEKGLLSCHK